MPAAKKPLRESRSLSTQDFLALAERFRSATELEEVKRLGDCIGRMVFGE